jgi:hypothetical protein
MQSVRMYTDGDGVVWAMAKCRVCGEVHKYLLTDAIAGAVKCKSCHRPMELDHALIETDERKRLPDGALAKPQRP